MFGNFLGGRGFSRGKKTRSQQQSSRIGRQPIGRSRIGLFELLEMRTMLTGISVTATNASQLTSDVATAVGTTGQQTYTINLTKTLSSGGAYTLTAGELDIPAFANPNMTLIIDGEGSTGPHATVINTAVTDRIFEIASGATVILENLEISGGKALDTDTGEVTTSPEGGGIYNDGALTLTNVQLTDNTASATAGGGNAYGGGIDSSGLLTIGGGSLIDGNYADGGPDTGGGAGYGNGGGAYINAVLSPPLQISDTTIKGNYAIGGNGLAGVGVGAGDDGGGGIGGGIIITDNGSPALLDEDTITDNTALGGNGGIGGTTINGGTAGTGLGGGAVIYGIAPVTVSRSLIAGNTAQGGTGDVETDGVGGFAVGGGISVFTISAATKLLNDTVYGNTATGGAGYRSGYGDSGGIDDESNGMFIVNDTVASNVAQAGVATGGPSGTSYGGGINIVTDIDLVVDNTIDAMNTATNGTDFYGTAASVDDNLIGNDTGNTAAGDASLRAPGSLVGPGVAPPALR